MHKSTHVSTLPVAASTVHYHSIMNYRKVLYGDWKFIEIGNLRALKSIMDRLSYYNCLTVPTGHFPFCRTSAEVLIRTVPIRTDNTIRFPFCSSSVAVPIRTERIMPRG